MIRSSPAFSKKKGAVAGRERTFGCIVGNRSPTSRGNAMGREQGSREGGNTMGVGRADTRRGGKRGGASRKMGLATKKGCRSSCPWLRGGAGWRSEQGMDAVARAGGEGLGIRVERMVCSAAGRRGRLEDEPR
jgi:hypothetical protein